MDFMRTPITGVEACDILDISPETYCELLAGGIMKSSARFPMALNFERRLHNFYDLLDVVFWALEDQWRSFLTDEDVEELVIALCDDLEEMVELAISERVGLDTETSGDRTATAQIYDAFSASYTEAEFALVRDKLNLIEAVLYSVLNRVMDTFAKYDPEEYSCVVVSRTRLRTTKNQVSRVFDCLLAPLDDRASSRHRQ